MFQVSEQSVQREESYKDFHFLFFSGSLVFVYSLVKISLFRHFFNVAATLQTQPIFSVLGSICSQDPVSMLGFSSWVKWFSGNDDILQSSGGEEEKEEGEEKHF